jgi:hypothetical protein
MNIGFWWECQEKSDHPEDLHLGWRIILRWILDRQAGVEWTVFILFRTGASEHGNETTSSIKCCGILLNICGNGSF